MKVCEEAQCDYVSGKWVSNGGTLTAFEFHKNDDGGYDKVTIKIESDGIHFHNHGWIRAQFDGDKIVPLKIVSELRDWVKGKTMYTLATVNPKCIAWLVKHTGV